MEQIILKGKAKGNFKSKVLVMVEDKRPLYRCKYEDHTAKQLRDAIADVQDCGAEAMANDDKIEIAECYQEQQVLQELLTKRLRR